MPSEANPFSVRPLSLPGRLRLLRPNQPGLLGLYRERLCDYDCRQVEEARLPAMCGLTGFWSRRGGMTREQLRDLATRMARLIEHRGPDDEGSFADERTGFAIGFRRLSIIDLSAAGHQPMHSASGRFTIAFNGEVYNFGTIKSELERGGDCPNFRGHSDTEVLLAAIEAWGLTGALERAVGMFAFALWDRQTAELSLVRDRLGVKPMYYACYDGTLLFGSELKPLQQHPAFQSDIDRDALTLYFRHGYFPAPFTVFRGCYKLQPGTVLTIQNPSAPLPAPVPYWSARQVALAGMENPFPGDDDELCQQLDALLRESVGLRLVSDVPLGVFLSGGIDSSVVAAIAQQQSARPVRTFSIGFAERDYDEAPHAKRVAAHLGSDHTELYVSAADALAVVPKLPTLYDEPFAGSSQIPTYLVSKMAREHVTVCLSGDGGDELFGGYNRYAYAADIWRTTQRLPLSGRRRIASALRRPGPDFWRALFEKPRAVLPRRLRIEQPADKIQKLIGMLELESVDGVYRHLTSLYASPAAIVIGGEEPLSPTRESDIPISDITQRMMFLDLVGYLPDDILVKVDRASMGVSLEAREPLLDHRLVEFAWRLPLTAKVREGTGKWLLRRVLDRYVPRTLIERPKIGFGIPIDRWLRGPLRDWAETLLAPDTLKSAGYLRAEPIQEALRAHLAGRTNQQNFLWCALMFQAWLDAR